MPELQQQPPPQPGMMDADALYLRLKGARERLCVAQHNLGDNPTHRQALERAILEIDRVATYHCPQWSRHDVPFEWHDDAGQG